MSYYIFKRGSTFYQFFACVVIFCELVLLHKSKIYQVWTSWRIFNNAQLVAFMFSPSQRTIWSNWFAFIVYIFNKITFMHAVVVSSYFNFFYQIFYPKNMYNKMKRRDRYSYKRNNKDEKYGVVFWLKFDFNEIIKFEKIILSKIHSAKYRY